MKRLLPLPLLLASTLPAMAHPAQFHPQDAGAALQSGFLHPLSGFDHLLVMVAVGLWAAKLGGRALWLLPCSFVGSMLLGSILGLGGIHLPAMEHGILTSMILLGAALGMAWRPALSVATLFIVAAGLCHGFAHGTEIPSGSLPLLFLAGMVCATAALHGSGLTIGAVAEKNSFSVVTRATGVALVATALLTAFLS